MNRERGSSWENCVSFIELDILMTFFRELSANWDIIIPKKAVVVINLPTQFSKTTQNLVYLQKSPGRFIMTTRTLRSLAVKDIHTENYAEYGVGCKKMYLGKIS
jgi:hypothetical protein